MALTAFVTVLLVVPFCCELAHVILSHRKRAAARTDRRWAAPAETAALRA
ncbi:MAG: hypothetical protein PVH47_07785 [Thiohalocapsa sp.]|jgi:hypothetical protein